MIPRTLFVKLLLLFLGFGALMTGVLIFVMRVSHATYHLELDQLRNRDLARQYVAAHLLVREPPLTVHNFASSLQHITEINPDIDVYVVDAQGTILAASVGDPHLARHRVDLAPIRRFVAGQTDFPLLGDNPTDRSRRGVFSAAPLAIPGCSAAYLYIVLTHHDSTSSIEHLKTTYTIGTEAGVLLAAAVAAIVASILFLRHLTRRLGVLQKDMEEFRDASVVAERSKDASGSRPGDEIEGLRALFLQLTAHIRAQMQELQKTDQQRREMLANCSHDLRTPLATLQTHLETLSLKVDLSAEERATYLAVAVQQCRRLVSLVDKLLTLAKLDARAVTISPEPFQLAELVQDVTMKWALPARRAGVVLITQPPSEGLPLVVGDVAWIELVLDNLLDNAVRYAGSDGRVTVRFALTSHTVRVGVHDSGAGIPEAEQACIFDHLYRGDSSRSSESGQAGLGLSIARAILALHGQSIDFVTAPGKGTTFFFELPRADRVGRIEVSMGEIPRRGAGRY